MTGYTPIYNLPYPQASDLVSAYPGTGQDLAEEVETVLAAKVATPSGGTDGQALVKAGAAVAWANIGKVLQVVSASTGAAFSTSSTSYVDWTGLSVSITPKASTSKFLVLCTFAGYNLNSGPNVSYKVDRNGTAVVESALSQVSGTYLVPAAISQLDSPATTATLTYKLQLKVSSGTWQANLGMANSHALTVIEIGA